MITLTRPTDAPDYRTAAHVAVYVAMAFALAALAVDRAGFTAQGYAGIVFGTVAFGMAVAYAAQHDRQQRRAFERNAAGQGGVR
jgi:hypothetical protein